MDHKGDLEALIEEANAEYERHEMDDPVLLDGTSEMHARNALNHLRNQRWQEALNEAKIASEQRDRWKQFYEIIIQVHRSALSVH